MRTRSSQRVHFGPGAIRHVGESLQAARSIFLVTGNASFTACGAEEALEFLRRSHDVQRFSGFPQNPTLSGVMEGLAAFRAAHFDAVVAVGGGSVLDMAKLIATLSAQVGEPELFIRGTLPVLRPGPPVIAVPTTAGSGSEATHFAVVFVDGRKYSLAHESMLPRVALVDPDLTASAPPRITASCGLDAFSQGVESLWSVHSTEESRALAGEAITLALRHLVSCVECPTPEARLGMCAASHAAGKAINLTKTTAPHALSYTMTSRFGVPHGHAVALTLGQVLAFNSGVTDEDVTDPRGAAFVRDTLEHLNQLLECDDAARALDRIEALISSVRLETRLSDLGIATDQERQMLVDNVDPQRLRNNPRALNRAQIQDLIRAIA